MLGRIVAAGGVAALLALAPQAAVAARDYSDVALNIIPSGQYGAVPVPPGADRQARMYDALTPLFDQVTNRDLFRYFKSARYGTAGQGPTRVERTPNRRVRIVRDRFNVPHITGRRRHDVIWGAGWVTAADRNLLLTTARGPSRVAALDIPGVNAFRLVTSLTQFTPSRSTERFLARQTAVLRSHGRRGRQLVRDIDSFTAGINAWFRANDQDVEPFGRNDIYAFNALLSSLFGAGGGSEATSAMLLDGLRDAHGNQRGTAIWTDLSEQDDPEADVSLNRRFPYEDQREPGPGNVIVDNGSLEPVLPAGGPVPTPSAATAPPRPGPASNALLVGARRSASGHPLFVAGPQIGYFYPGLTLEMDVQGGGLSWRGATSAPFPGYMLIGRGPDFALSLTSANGDITDEYVETLCGGSDVRYRYRGRCVPMRRVNAGTVELEDGPTPLVYHETVHGPVVAYATVDGRRVAISEHRTSRGREAVFQLAFQQASDGTVRSARSFMRAMNASPQTFNAFYADDRDIAMFSAGRYPIRPPGVDPDLPRTGTGGYENRGFLPFARHPRGINPRRGAITNWNNKPARDFRSSDENFAWGSVERNTLLADGIARRRTHTLASVTAAMNAAATQDLRTYAVWPWIRRVLATPGPAPSPLAARMIELLDRWRASGSSRRDADRDGAIDEPGAAIMDAAWDPIATSVIGTWLDAGLRDLLDSLNAIDNEPPGGFFQGWYGYVQKDLRQLLGVPVRGPYRTRYCGRGDLAACRASLLAALESAGAALAAAQGPDPAAWRASATAEAIEFAPINILTMAWTNRPSGIQQVISFDGHRPRGVRRTPARRRAGGFTGSRRPG